MDIPAKTGVAGQLFQLQAFDLEIEAGRGALRQINSRLGESQELLSARADLATRTKQLEDLCREQQSLEWEIDDQTGKIIALEDKLYGGKVTNPKELSSLQQDVESLKRRRKQFEDKALEIMEWRERETAAARASGDELSRLEKAWQDEQQRLKQEAASIKASLGSLEPRREELRMSLDTGIGKLYETLRAQKGNAVAGVQQGICQGCRISLSQSQLQQVRTGVLVKCGNCGRVLYLA